MIIYPAKPPIRKLRVYQVIPNKYITLLINRYHPYPIVKRLTSGRDLPYRDLLHRAYACHLLASNPIKSILQLGVPTFYWATLRS